MYPKLKEMIFVRGVKQKTMAEALSISTRSFSKKLNGHVPFSWPEVCILHGRFFPDIPKDELFCENKQQANYTDTPPASGE